MRTQEKKKKAVARDPDEEEEEEEEEEGEEEGEAEGEEGKGEEGAVAALDDAVASLSLAGGGSGEQSNAADVEGLKATGLPVAPLCARPCGSGASGAAMSGGPTVGAALSGSQSASPRQPIGRFHQSIGRAQSPRGGAREPVRSKSPRDRGKGLDAKPARSIAAAQSELGSLRHAARGMATEAAAHAATNAATHAAAHADATVALGPPSVHGLTALGERPLPTLGERTLGDRARSTTGNSGVLRGSKVGGSVPGKPKVGRRKAGGGVAEVASLKEIRRPSGLQLDL